MAQRVNAENFEEKVLKADKPVLLDFYSDTCIPCKRMAGPLGDIEEEFEGRLYVYKVNVSYDPDLTEKYGVMSVPTFVVISKGEEVNRMVGAVGKDKLKELFEAYI